MATPPHSSPGENEPTPAAGGGDQTPGPEQPVARQSAVSVPPPAKVANLVLARLFAATVALLGGAVMVAWKLEWREVLLFGTNVVPMQFNTAMGFSVAGLTMILMLNGWARTAAIGGIFCSVLGLVTIGEYIAGSNLGVDQFFQPDFLGTGLSANPGRMAPNAAACFLLFGLCVTSLARIRDPWREHFVVGAVAVTICALGLVYSLGYYTGVAQSYDLRYLSRMSLHSGVAFVLLGAAMALLVWENPFQPLKTRKLALPVIVGLMGFVGTLVFWHSLIRGEQERIEASISTQLRIVAQQTREHAERHVLMLQWLSSRLPVEGAGLRERWEVESGSYLRLDPAVDVVGWYAHGRTGWVVARTATPAVAEVIQRVFDQSPPAEGTARGVAAELVQDRTGNRYLLLQARHPTVLDPEEMLVAALELTAFKQRVFGGITGDFAVTLQVDGVEVFHHGSADRSNAGRWGETAIFRVGRAEWQIDVWPGRLLFAQKYSSIPDLTLLVGVILSLLFPVALQDTHRMRKLAREARERSEKLEKLLPICAGCKRIRSEEADPYDPASWTDIDTFLTQEEGRILTHGICPHCLDDQLRKIDRL